MSLLYATGNLVDADTLFSVSTENLLLPFLKENLYNQRPGLPFRFTSALTGTICVDAGLGNTIQPTFVGVINHNLATETVYKLEGSNIACGGGGGESWDLTLCTNHNNSGRKITPAIGYRYWQLVITGTTVDATPKIEIGELILTDWANFTTLYVVTEGEGPMINTGSQKTHYGQPWDVYYSDGMVFVLQPIQVSTEGEIEEMRTFLQDLEGSAGRFIYCPDDTYLNTKCQLYYVKVEGQEFAANRLRTGSADMLQWSLRLEELPNGINFVE